MEHGKRFLIRHLGNMGDMVFFIPPVVETLKKKYPDCHITFVTAWGYKQKTVWSQMSWRDAIDAFSALMRGKLLERPAHWGQRNQGGFSIALMMTNPHIDQLIHWHDTKLDLAGHTCQEEGRSFPTWNKSYYEQQKKSGGYAGVYELDFGLSMNDNPIQKMYEALDLPEENFSQYHLYFTDEDKAIAQAVMNGKPRPRIMLLEALAAANTRGWDPDKLPRLEQAIKKTYGVDPMWFGGKYIPEHKGQPLTLRQNIATFLYADAVIGVLSGPLHFAAAVGVPTLTLYGDQPLHRAAPAYFLNEYTPEHKKHRTLLGPSPTPITFLKDETAPAVLTAREQSGQGYKGWLQPGHQATKACLAPITVPEVMLILHDMLQPV